MLSVTNQTTMAMLLMLLPYFADFGKRADISVALPTRTNDVMRFTCTQLDGGPNAYVMFTNNAEMWFAHGIVSGYRTPLSYYDLQDPNEIPRFFGPVNVNKAEAIAIARNLLVKVGYDLKDCFADQDPIVTMPPKTGTNVVSYYQLRWMDPVESRPSVQVGLSGIDGKVASFRLFSSVFWRQPPRVAATDPGDASDTTTNARAIRALIPGILTNAATFCSNINLSIFVPSEIAAVDHCEGLEGTNNIELRLTNGYWLYFVKGYVRGFSAPESCFKRQPEDKRLPIERYVGRWNMTEADALALARGVVRNADSTIRDINVSDPPTEKLAFKQTGNYVIPRFFFQWTKSSDSRPGVATTDIQIEIDADTKTVKYLYIWNGRLWK